MALIKCPECGKEFSDKAKACPNCACPVTNISNGLNLKKKTNKKVSANTVTASMDNVLIDKCKKAATHNYNICFYIILVLVNLPFLFSENFFLIFIILILLGAIWEYLISMLNKTYSNVLYKNFNIRVNDDFITAKAVRFIPTNSQRDIALAIFNNPVFDLNIPLSEIRGVQILPCMVQSNPFSKKSAQIFYNLYIETGNDHYLIGFINNIDAVKKAIDDRIKKD